MSQILDIRKKINISACWTSHLKKILFIFQTLELSLIKKMLSAWSQLQYLVLKDIVFSIIFQNVNKKIY